MSQDSGRDPLEPIFNQIYERHYPSLYAYFFGRSSDAELALDLLQETFTRAWQHIATLGVMEEGQHAYWLFSVAKNLFTDSIRRTARWQKIEGEMSAATQQTIGYAHDQMVPHDQLIVLNEAIAQLSEQLRIVLSMSVLGGMSSQQIGEALDMAPGTVRYQLSVARKQLMTHLEKE